MSYDLEGLNEETLANDQAAEGRGLWHGERKVVLHELAVLASLLVVVAAVGGLVWALT